MSLNAHRVMLIRTSGFTDTYFARIWRVEVRTVRNARTGKTWASHPTPPDTVKRRGGGRLSPKYRWRDRVRRTFEARA